MLLAQNIMCRFIGFIQFFMCFLSAGKNIRPSIYFEFKRIMHLFGIKINIFIFISIINSITWQSCLLMWKACNLYFFIRNIFSTSLNLLPIRCHLRIYKIKLHSNQIFSFSFLMGCVKKLTLIFECPNLVSAVKFWPFYINFPRHDVHRLH